MELDEALVEARKLVASVSGITFSELSIDSSSDLVPEWDSLSHMEIISALEARIGVRLSREQMVEISSITGIARVLVSQEDSGAVG